MKALYIFLGAYSLINGICTMAGITSMDQTTAGLYAVCLGLTTILCVVDGRRK